MRFIMDPPDKDGYIEMREVDQDGTEAIIAWIRFDGYDQTRIANAKLMLDAMNLLAYGVCDDGINCEQRHPQILNEYGRCSCCEEQREYEDDNFAFTDGGEEE